MPKPHLTVFWPASLAAAIVLLVVIAPTVARACRPRADQAYPTLEDNFRRAKSVYYATISRSTPSDKVLKLELKIEKIFKGAAPNQGFVLTNEPSSCDRLAYGIVAGDGCIFFQLADGKLATSMFDGEATFCLPMGAPRLKTLAAEFSEKFKFGKSEPKP